jgi:hypothetical protein
MSVPSPDDRRSLLRADCAECFGLCCVALSFQRSADFAFDKPASDPCPNLATDFSCGIHERLRPNGFRGCTVFDCFGAGQKVAQTTYRGVIWRDDPRARSEMFAVFPIMRDLHELLWYLGEAAQLPVGSSLARDVESSYSTTYSLTEGDPDELLRLDAVGHRDAVAALLGRVSDHVRSRMNEPWRRTRSTRDVAPRSDLMGRRFSGSSLRGADLRGAYLIAADLRATDLTMTDLIGADLRDARIEDANLAESLFLTQPQANSAIGNSGTRLPPGLERPSHWS